MIEIHESDDEENATQNDAPKTIKYSVPIASHPFPHGSSFLNDIRIPIPEILDTREFVQQYDHIATLPPNHQFNDRPTQRTDQLSQDFFALSPSSNYAYTYTFGNGNLGDPNGDTKGGLCVRVVLVVVVSDRGVCVCDCVGVGAGVGVTDVNTGDLFSLVVVVVVFVFVADVAEVVEDTGLCTGVLGGEVAFAAPMGLLGAVVVVVVGEPTTGEKAGWCSWMNVLPGSSCGMRTCFLVVAGPGPEPENGDVFWSYAGGDEPSPPPLGNRCHCPCPVVPPPMTGEPAFVIVIVVISGLGSSWVVGLLEDAVAAI